MPKRSSRDDDDDDAPRRRKRPSKKQKGINPLLITLIAVGALLVIGGGSVAAYFIFREKSAGPPPPQDPFPNMIAHWSFDNVKDGKVTDQTGRGNNGVLTGGRLAPGVKGDALWLDGRDDQYCELNQSKDLNFAEGAELTLAAWY